jgi:hypothetical protein
MIDFKKRFPVTEEVNSFKQYCLTQRASSWNASSFSFQDSQVLLDRIGAPDNLWFLAQHYLVNVHDLCANRQLNWKIPEQVSRGGGHQAYPIPQWFIVLKLYCIWIQSQHFQKLQ